MRGIPVPELSTITTKAILMEVYHIPYSELEDIPIKDAFFLLSLYESKEKFKEQKMKQEQAKIKSRGRR